MERAKKKRKEIEPHMCAISYEQLMTFADTTFKDKYRQDFFGYPRKTMRDVVQDILEPACERYGKPYALFLNPDGLPVGAFLTHCWDEPFVNFVESIRRLFHPFVTKPNLWVCSFALHQGRQAVHQALDVPLDQSPFIRALSQATKFVVVRNAKVDLYTRMWCVCELMFASQYGFAAEDGAGDNQKETLVIGPNIVSSHKSVAEAEAFYPKDKHKILELLELKYRAGEIDALVMAYRRHGSYHSTVDHMFEVLHSAASIGVMLLLFGICCFLVFLLWWLVFDPPDYLNHPRVIATIVILFVSLAIWVCWLAGWFCVPYFTFYDGFDSFTGGRQQQEQQPVQRISAGTATTVQESGDLEAGFTCPSGAAAP